MGMEPVAEIIKKDRTILTIDISEVEEMFETKEAEPVESEPQASASLSESLIESNEDNEEEDNETISVMMWSLVHGLATLHLRRRTMIFPEERRVQLLEDAYAKFTEIIKHYKK